MDGTSVELANNEQVRAAYLGIDARPGPSR